MIVETIAGPFNLVRYKALKTLYEAAVKEQKSEFYVDNKPILTSFAKYLLEFLESRFKNIK